MRITRGKLQPREAAFTAFALVFAIGAFSSAVVGPTEKKIRDLEGQIVKAQKEVAMGKKLLGVAGVESPAAQAVAKASKIGSKPVQSYLAKNRNFGDLIRNLSGDGGSFRVNRLALEKQEEKSGFSKNTFTLEIETSFLELGHFVEVLEKSDFLVEILSVDVSRMSQELKRCTAKIMLNSYVARN